MKPAMRRCIVQEGRAGPWQHDFAFDPTYGRSRDDLLALPPPEEPGDFEAFWRATYQQNESLPLRYTLHAVPYPDPLVTAYRVSFDCWGGATSGAWLLEPTRGRARLACVIGHGYGGREDIEPGDWCLNCPDDRDVARIFPVARGFHISPHEGIPYNDGHSHVLHGIAHRDTYVLRGCVAEQWTCSRILQERHPHLAGRQLYTGGSFGGGIGALMLPWCDRFLGAHLGIPTFGHHPIRLRSPSAGHLQRVQQYALSHPEVVDVLGYYDAACAARRIRIPVAISAALFDPVVPPPGQFAIANALAGDVRLTIFSHGHFPHPETAGEAPRHELAAGRFLRRLAGAN